MRLHHLLFLAAALSGAGPVPACPPAEVKGQPWSCEDYVAEDGKPWPGCKWESVEARERYLAALSNEEKVAIAERLLCPTGVIDWTAAGPTCD